MAKIKWLWSIAIAMGIVLLYASLSAYFVKIDGWYFQLKLPPLALSPKGMAIGWSIAYIVNIAIIARLIFYREHSPIILPLVIIGIVNIIWCMCFFTFRCALAGFIILIIQCILVFAVFIMLIRRDSLSMILSQPLLAWYIYLTVTNYYIYVLNI
ncbi:MAG: tryptophan-rich sensory protein [Clostridia bacterium]|nr:tryptophan-rich sensory protein [Clostridia bacterium]